MKSRPKYFLGYIVLAHHEVLVGFYNRSAIAAKSYALEKLNLCPTTAPHAERMRVWRKYRRYHHLTIHRVYAQ